MGTYTTNYQLYMPTIGEQGWGELINGNYQTIDTTMKSFSNRIGTLETEADAIEERTTASEERIAAIENTIPEEGIVDAENISTDYITLPLNPNGDIELWSQSSTIYSNSDGTLYTNAFSCPLKNTGSIRYSGTCYVTLSIFSNQQRTVTVYIDNAVYETFTVYTDKNNPLVKYYNLPIRSTIHITTTGGTLNGGGSISGVAKI